MKWILLLTGVCVVIATCLEWRRRQRAYWEGPFLVQQIRAWYVREAFGDEPEIQPLALPPIKPLRAVRDSDKVWRKLRRA